MSETTGGPVTQAQRLESIDVLRGVALLGILVMNIQSFAMPMAAYANPRAYGDLHGANYWVYVFSHLLADMKFMSIFSMLFGAGIVIFTARLQRAGRNPAAIHFRRMGWLLLAGLVHAYLLWYGDILVLYAICGMAVYFARRWMPRTLMLVGLVMVALSMAVMFSVGRSYETAQRRIEEELSREPVGQIVDPQILDTKERYDRGLEYWQPSQERIDKETAAMTGSYANEVRFRAPVALGIQAQLIPFWGFWRAGGLMLVGMALFKLNILSAVKARVLYLMMLVAGLAMGIGLIVIGLVRNEAHDFAYVSFKYNSTFNAIGSMLVALAWIGAVMLWCKSRALSRLRHAVACVGQMAFTNYLLQTIVCTTIFYGRSGLGLAQFGKFDRVDQALVVLGVWILQIVISPLWLRVFRFGPAEWLWRSATYWQLQPMRRRGVEATAR